MWKLKSKRVKRLEDYAEALEKERDTLLASIEELKEKRTVSQMTPEEETPPTQAQILDEYLNGVDEE